MDDLVAEIEERMTRLERRQRDIERALDDELEERRRVVGRLDVALTEVRRLVERLDDLDEWRHIQNGEVSRVKLSMKAAGSALTFPARQ